MTNPSLSKHFIFLFVLSLFSTIYLSSCSNNSLNTGEQRIGVQATPSFISFSGIENNSQALITLNNYDETAAVISSIKSSDAGYSISPNVVSDTLPGFGLKQLTLKLDYALFDGSDTARVVIHISGSANTDSVVIKVKGPRKAITRNLSNNSFSERPIDITADNSKILFVSNREGTQQVYTMDNRGGSIQKISPDLSLNYNAVKFTTDEDKILFYSYSADTTTSIYLHDIALGTDDLILQRQGYNVPVDISSDGLKILYNKRVGVQNDVYVIDIDGSNKVELAADPIINEIAVFFEPRDQRILYHTLEGVKHQMYKIRVSGENRKLISDGTGDDIPVATTKDGSTLVFYSDRLNRREVMLCNWEGENIIQTTNNLLYDYPADIHGDTRNVLFMTTINGNSEIYESGYNGERLFRLTINIFDDIAVKYSPDSKYVLMYRNQPNAQVYIIDLRSYRF